MKPFIFIYGPPGVGKSAVGFALAESLNLAFIDLDLEIERTAQTTIPQIFEQQGESMFRTIESQALEATLQGQPGVVALGGGALLAPENRATAETRGDIFCLSASLETLLARLGKGADYRPLLSSDTASKLLELLSQRRAHYTSFDQQIDTEHLSLEDTVWKIQVQSGRYHIRGMGAGYDARIGSGELENIGELLECNGLNGPIALISDENVASHYSGITSESLLNAGYTVQTMTFPAGEHHKTLETVSNLWNAFLVAKIERGSTVIALGGGVVGDLAGFAAATYLRGVPWVGVPTSLLAMADSSLGGKTGADLPQGKNLIGAFHSPRLVLADPQLLNTLPEVEFRNGMAEVLKAGIIADPVLFDLCALGLDAVQNNLAEVVRRAMAVKIKIIQEDPFESGKRASLNLGHTIGHAVEKLSDYRLRHGEAVAIGMVAEARLAVELGLASADLVDRIKNALITLKLPTNIPADMQIQDILQTTQVDKKRSGGIVRYALPCQIGKVKIGVTVDNVTAILE